MVKKNKRFSAQTNYFIGLQFTIKYIRTKQSYVSLFFLNFPVFYFSFTQINENNIS